MRGPTRVYRWRGRLGGRSTRLALRGPRRAFWTRSRNPESLDSSDDRHMVGGRRTIATPRLFPAAVSAACTTSGNDSSLTGTWTATAELEPCPTCATHFAFDLYEYPRSLVTGAGGVHSVSGVPRRGPSPGLPPISSFRYPVLWGKPNALSKPCVAASPNLVTAHSPPTGQAGIVTAFLRSVIGTVAGVHVSRRIAATCEV